MSNPKKRNKNRLTTHEQKTTATYKLLSDRIEVLEKSLKNTQDELERYRTKYHQVDKNHAIEKSKHEIHMLHEILKFVISGVGVGLGVNWITGGKLFWGLVSMVAAIALYILIVFFESR